MRSVIAIVSSAALVVAQIPVAPAFAEGAPPAPQSARLNPAQAEKYNPAVAAAFNAFPKGGELLSQRIADLIVKEPRVSLDLIKYVRETASLNSAQKLAAERGVAIALDRLGINAADMHVYKKAPPPPEEERDWLLPALVFAGAGVGIGCLVSFCRHDHVSGD